MNDTQIRDPHAYRQQLLLRVFFRARCVGLLVLLTSLTTLTACGGGSTNSSQGDGVLSANWQFTLSAPTDGTFVGGLQGGFLQQKKGAVNGAAVYAISLPATNGGTPTLCNSGSATITGTVSGQSVTLTAVAGGQTFTLTGTLSADNSTISGMYNSTAGGSVSDPNNPNNTVPCGTSQTGQQWTAISVPSLTGSVQGSFHSTSSSLGNQDFPVTGSLTQGPNIGASSATVSGALNFQGYPCMAVASVNGEISGNSVILQIIALNGLDVGQIGAQPGISFPSPVTLTSSASGGFVLHGASGYGLSTGTCKGGVIPGGGVPGDFGNICLALGNSKACSQPLTLAPATLSFPLQRVGSPATTQTVTLTNTDPSGATLNGITLGLTVTPSSSSSPSDFDLLPSFIEQDNCASTVGSPFSLGPQQSCTISISFSPQQSCPWLPFSGTGGTVPAQCPPFLGTAIPTPPAQTAILTATSPTSAEEDSDGSFAVPISGTGISQLVPSTPELDFGAEALSESSLPQPLSFTNEGTTPVQILPSLTAPPPPCAAPNQPVLLQRPLVPGSASGLQVVTGAISFANSTVDYICDIDPTSLQPNFQISSDTCSGALLAPQQSCSLAIAFAPQPGTSLAPPLDYFLELNTLQCTSNTTSNCEIDAGRFPVELKTNLPSPLRMSPGAGLEFGLQPKGQPSDLPLTLTLFNDPNDPNSQTINFTGKIVKGDYTETDNCGPSLAPGASCTFAVTFTPKQRVFDPGSITITYNNGQVQTVYMRGFGE